MKVILSVLILTSTAALAQPSCLRADSRDAYNARPISLHEVLAKNALGSDHRAYRVTTTCIHVDRTAGVALSSMTSCLALGDNVSTTTIDGRREMCRVTAVTPVAEDYAAAKYKD
jgi:hypothetical protein